MAHTPTDDRVQSLSIKQLVGELAATGERIARKEVELARAEVKADLQTEIAAAKGLAIGGLLALLGLNALIVALVLALAAHMPGWLAALLVGGVLVLAGAIVGWASWTRRVTRPLELTRNSVKETAQWAKGHVA